MHPRTLVTAVLALCLLSPFARATHADGPLGTIEGRVTVAGRPAEGVAVLLLAPGERAGAGLVAKTASDASGRFRFSDVAAGQYVIASSSPALVDSQARSAGLAGQVVSVAPAESVEGLDLSLVPGAVVTGRVTDADGRPVIGRLVTLLAVEDSGAGTPIASPRLDPFLTDDRGIYRVYGLAPGRYRVCVGDSPGAGPRAPRIFAPGVEAEAEAGVVEIASGAEAQGVDIAISGSRSTHAVTGRVVSAETGEPIAGVTFGYGALPLTGGNRFGSTLNAKGEFRIASLAPGRYALFAVPGSAHVEWFSDATVFEVPQREPGALELRLFRGASVSGTVVVEGPNGEVQGQLAGLRLGTFSAIEQPDPVLRIPPATIVVGADGSFRGSGLRPGLVRFYLADAHGPKGFAIVRVERDGVEQPSGVEMEAGEHVGTLRIVLAYGTGGLRGRVDVRGGELPADASLAVTVRRVGTGAAVAVRHVSVDDRRAFAVDSLAPGDYEVTVRAFSKQAGPLGTASGPSTRTVSVAGEGVSETVLTLELGKGDGR